MTYKILVIDEELAEIRKVQLEFDPMITSDEVDVIPFLPKPDLSIMIDSILAEGPDALIVDYQLNTIKTDIGRDTQINYTGADLVDAFRNRRLYFPCFIASSFEDSAVGDKNTADVNMVYSKMELNSQIIKKIRFRDRVKMQIVKYHNLISQKETRLENLLARKVKGDSLTINEEEEIVEIDTFIENSLDRESSIPRELKVVSNKEKLRELIEITENLIKGVRGER